MAERIESAVIEGKAGGGAVSWAKTGSARSNQAATTARMRMDRWAGTEECTGRERPVWGRIQARGTEAGFTERNSFAYLRQPPLPGRRWGEGFTAPCLSTVRRRSRLTRTGSDVRCMS